VLAITLAMPLKVPAQVVLQDLSGFVREIPLSESERLDAIRYLQARIVQPGEEGLCDGDTGAVFHGRYLARGVRVLQPEVGNQGVFAYLVTFQTDGPENLAYDLNDYYTVEGYYLVLITRSGEDFTLIDEFLLTPPELAVRLELRAIPPPPTLTWDSENMDFNDAVFDASDPALAEWRADLVNVIRPRLDFVDLTGDGLLDCILDIEGFEFQPTSYYIVLASASYGFMEGFRRWGYETDFSEAIEDGSGVIRAETYSLTPSGDYLPSWRDYYIWNGSRFILANLNYAEDYEDLMSALVELAGESVREETSSGGRFDGMTRYVINLQRYRERQGLPAEYYFNLARISEYRLSGEEARAWWTTLMGYLNAEYDSEEISDMDELEAGISEIVQAYGDWRDELYATAEAALSEE